MRKNGKRIKAIIAGGILIGALVYASVGKTAVYRCDACPAGTYSDGTLTSCEDCPAGTYSHAGAGSCTKCPAGYYSNAGAGSCIQCKAGTYASAGSSSCSTCDYDSYSSAGASSCTSCPSRHVAPKGSTSQSACKSCSGDTYVDAGQCKSCSSGYKLNSSKTGCDRCYIPSGSYALSNSTTIISKKGYVHPNCTPPSGGWATITSGTTGSTSYKYLCKLSGNTEIAWQATGDSGDDGMCGTYHYTNWCIKTNGSLTACDYM